MGLSSHTRRTAGEFRWDWTTDFAVQVKGVRGSAASGIGSRFSSSWRTLGTVAMAYFCWVCHLHLLKSWRNQSCLDQVCNDWSVYFCRCFWVLTIQFLGLYWQPLSLSWYLVPNDLNHTLDDGWPESEKDVFQAALRMVVVKDSRWIVGEFYMSYGKIWCEKVRLIKKRIFGKGHQMTCVLQPQRERGGRDKEREREKRERKRRERERENERGG